MEAPLEFRAGEVISVSELSFLKDCGLHVKIFRGCRLIPPERISVGHHTQIDEGVRIFAGGEVRLGSYVHLAFGAAIFGGGSCDIGDFASIGVGVRIITGTDLPSGGMTNPTIPPELRAVERSSVRIGRHALLYTGAMVLPGNEVPDGAVVAAGGIVHKSLQPWAIYAGNPLVKVGSRDPEPILANEKKAFGLANG